MINVTHWSIAGPTILAAFLASAVEVVEAFTIVLAVGTLRGWRPAWAGVGAALVVLALVVIFLGPLLSQFPIGYLQFAIGVLLLLFGMGWLRKAILRSAGILALHDEVAIYRSETTSLSGALASSASSQNWIAGLAAFKAVLLEGLEVVFIVIAVGSGRGLLIPASLGALGACIAVLAVGVCIRKPLSSVPENTLKFAVGIILSSFGIFWTGEGLGISWPGQDSVLLMFGALFLASGLFLAKVLRRAVRGE